MTTAAAQVLQAWSNAIGSPVITELAPGRVWTVSTEHGDRYVLKMVATSGAPDPVRRFTGEARILTYLLQRGVPVAVPVLTDDGRVCTTGGDGANDDIPALALAAALGLLAYFIQEHDLVEESWLRAACWIGDNFGTLRLPAGATGG